MDLSERLLPATSPLSFAAILVIRLFDECEAGMMEWERNAAEFEWDGSLRDIYVLGTSEADWDKVLTRLGEYDPPPIYKVDGINETIPERVKDIFRIRSRRSPLLMVMVGNATLNCNFFKSDEIEFDLDSRDITGPVQAEMLACFMRLLGETTKKPVILCRENQQELVIARYSYPDSDVAWSGRPEHHDRHGVG